MDAKAELEDFFNKKFEFKRSSNWILPHKDVLFKDSTWELKNLMTLKSKLNDTKSLLNDKNETWQEHTNKINKAGLVLSTVRKLFKPDFLTNAWCKFFEILASFPVTQPNSSDCFRTLHLCEAPGAFISALNYYLWLHHPNTFWEWYGNTLNPYYEGHSVKSVVVDDRLIFHTLKHWLFGQDNTGDVTSLTCAKDIKEFLKSKGPVHLVTADGSIDCLDNPGEQELSVSYLHFCELLMCLNVLEPGGSFVIKKFTCFECISVCVLYLLNCLFEKVHVFKPVTSKAGNSEVYVVCLGFQGIPSESYLNILQNCQDVKEFALFPKSFVPPSFIKQLEECCTFFTNHQISAIQGNLELWDCMTHEKLQHIDELQNACASMYLDKYSLQAPCHYVRLYNPQKYIKTSYGGDEHRNIKIFYYKHVGSTFKDVEFRKYMSQNQLLDDLEHRINVCFPVDTKRPICHEVCWFPIWKEVQSNMKRKNYEYWITTGTAVSSVQNSKFCNPVLLSFWNEAILGRKILFENHAITSHQHWNWGDWVSLVKKCPVMSRTEMIVHVHVDCVCDSVITTGLASAFGENIVISNCVVDSIACDASPNSTKLVLIDRVNWDPPTFQQELLCHRSFVQVILKVVKALHIGDSVVLHLQSLLTRFHVGILFMLLSLFSQAVTLLPESSAPALCGQIWVLSNFQKPQHTERMLEYLKLSVLNYQSKSGWSILEVVPISAICSHQFYEYLLIVNNRFMLQRLRKLVAIEKGSVRNEA